MANEINSLLFKGENYPFYDKNASQQINILKQKFNDNSFNINNDNLYINQGKDNQIVIPQYNSSSIILDNYNSSKSENRILSISSANELYKKICHQLYQAELNNSQLLNQNPNNIVSNPNNRITCSIYDNYLAFNFYIYLNVEKVVSLSRTHEEEYYKYKLCDLPLYQDNIIDKKFFWSLFSYGQKSSYWIYYKRLEKTILYNNREEQKLTLYLDFSPEGISFSTGYDYSNFWTVGSFITTIN